MPDNPWLIILKQQVADKGPKQVAKELGISRPTVDLVTQGKYQADIGKILDRVAKIYGHNGSVPCPVKGILSPNQCAEYWNRAKKIGLNVGNPETLKLHKTCLNCPLRK